MTTNEKGQSSIEAAIMAFFLIVFVICLCGTIYLIYASYWAEHIMYESLICYQEREQKSFCTREAEQKIDSTLIFKNAYTFKLETGSNVTRAKIQMNINAPVIKKKTLEFKKELRI